MGRLGITKEDVFTACRALVERGTPVTQENVRNELKTGSYTTVWRHVKSFKTEEDEKEAMDPAKTTLILPPDSLTADAVQLAQSLWQKASALAQAEVQNLKAARDELSNDLDMKVEEFDSLFTETTKLEETLETALRELGSAKETALKSSGETDTLKTHLAAKEQEVKSLLERALGAEQALGAKSKENSELFSQSERYKASRDALEKELTQVKAGVISQTSELTNLKQRLIESEREFRALLERAISAEKELSFIKKSPK